MLALRRMVLWMAIFVSLPLPVIRAAPGDLDTSFGVGGKRFAPMMTTSGNGGQKVALQADGKAVICGYTYIGGSGSTFNLDGSVARFTTAGALDTTFGGTGKVNVAFGPRDDIFYAIAVQQDGKIVAAGRWFNGTTSGNFDAVTARLLPDGTLDTSFGGTGKVVTSLGTDDSAGAVVIQIDGKIVIGGTAIPSGSGLEDFALARYLSDGTLDASFGGTGKVVTARGGDQRINSLVLQSDGKIIAAGRDGSFIGLARYLPNGTLDTTFGTGGWATTAGATDFGTHVALQSDGKILVSSWAWNGSNYDLGVTRFLADGARDTAFGTMGRVSVNLGNPNQFALCVTVQQDGSILVGGYVTNGTTDGLALVRFDSAGNLDSTFGNGGKIVDTSGRAYGLAVRADGRIVVSLGGGVARYLGGIASPLENWKLTQLGDIHAPDNANIDGDAYVNLAEYGLVLDPHSFSTVPSGPYAYADGTRLRILFTRDPERNDVTIEAEATDNLAGPWTTLASSVLGAPMRGPGYLSGDGADTGLKTVEVRDVVNVGDPAHPNRFLRLRVRR
jgi:uncharacterized delta-60 repeat protein